MIETIEPSNSKECNCINYSLGFNCMCNWEKENPGNNDYSCNYCGLYTASKPQCNRCENITEP